MNAIKSTRTISPFNVAELQARLSEQRKDRIGALATRAKDRKLAKAKSVMLQEHASADKQIKDARRGLNVALGTAVVGIFTSAAGGFSGFGGVAGVVAQIVSFAATLISSVVSGIFSKLGADSAEKSAEMKAILAGDKQLKIELERELKKLEDQETDFAAQRDEAQQLASRLNEHHNRIAELTA